jgi:IS5 family transposase
VEQFSKDIIKHRTKKKRTLNDKETKYNKADKKPRKRRSR